VHGLHRNRSQVAGQPFEVALPDGVTTGATLWLRLWIDFDQDGVLSAGDLRALIEVGGDPVETSFVVTIS